MIFNPVPFQLWLINRNYSTSTVKNYLADVNKYVRYAQSNHSQNQFLSVESISSYLATISDKANYTRYLASLNKFCQFAIDQKIISSNPVKKINKLSNAKYQPNSLNDTNQIINLFTIYLKKQNKSNSTIKNYLVDINQFLDWANNES